MPYSRPPLSQLKSQAAQDIAAGLPGADSLLRFSNLGILGRMLAGLANLHYGYLDWIAKMAVPYTSSGEWLMAWGALKAVYLKAATTAGSTGGAVTFTNCAVGTIVPHDVPLVRADGTQYTNLNDAVVDGAGNVTLTPLAVAKGSDGNCINGTAISLGVSIAGMQSTGAVTTPITGGTDDEPMEQYRSRVLQAYQNQPQGGARVDYIRWAREVPGVTRAWCYPIEQGAGTVVVRFMMDDNGAGGFPVGTDGVASDETRAVPATGDQLAVANYIYGDDTTERQPVTALVYAVAPTPDAIDFTIDNIATVGAGIKTQIAAAIAGAFVQFGAPGVTFDLDNIEAAIAAIPGTDGFVITDPPDNITLATGALPTVGLIVYT